MIYTLFNYLTGYVRLKIEGVGLEKVLRKCPYILWDVSRPSYTVMYCSLSLLGYRKLKKKLDGVKVTVVEEHGLYRLFTSLWQKKVLFFGLAAMILLGVCLSSFVFKIEINGYEKLDHRKIQEYVEQFGIKPGTLKQKTDLQALCRELERKPEIAWASAGYSGVVLNVTIIEAKRKDDMTPCDIIAQYDAVIKRNSVFSGNKLKMEGDTVQKGDVLVSGLTVKEDGTVEGVASRAEIIGTIWAEGEGRVPVTNIRANRTGRTTTERYLEFAGYRSIIERGSQQDFAHYESEAIRRVIGGQQGILPVFAVERTYYEVELEELPKEIQQLQESARLTGLENTVQNLPENAKIVNEEISYRVEDGQMIAQVLLELEVPIGVRRELGYKGD